MGLSRRRALIVGGAAALVFPLGCSLFVDAGDYAVGDAGRDASVPHDTGTRRDASSHDSGEKHEASEAAPRVCDAAACELGAVSTSATTRYYSVAAGSNAVYFSDGLTIWTCALTSCGGGPTVLYNAAPDSAPVLGLAVVGDAFYWSEGSNILSCTPPHGCSAENYTVEALASVTSFSVGSQAVFFATLANGDQPAQLATYTFLGDSGILPLISFDAGGAPVSVVERGDTVYTTYVSPDASTSAVIAYANGQDAAVAVIAVGDGVLDNRVRPQPDAGFFTGASADDGGIYWIETTGRLGYCAASDLAAGPDAASVCSKNVGAQSFDAAATSTYGGLLFVSGASGAPDASGIIYAGANVPGLAEVSAFSGAPAAVSANATAVYWLDSSTPSLLRLMNTLRR